MAWEGNADVLAITENKKVKLANYENVLGYSLMVPSDSANNATVGINSAPPIELMAGDPTIGFGGFTIGNEPVLYNDELDIRFDTTNPGSNRVLLILTRIRQCK